MKPSNSAPSTNPIAPPTPLLYRISTVMALLQISHATVYRMVARGELEVVKLSTRASRITASSVARVLSNREGHDGRQSPCCSTSGGAAKQ